MIHNVNWDLDPRINVDAHKFLCDKCQQDISDKARLAIKMSFGKPGSHFTLKGIFRQVVRWVYFGLPDPPFYLKNQWSLSLFNSKYRIAITLFERSF